MNIFQWLKKQGYEYTWNIRIGTKTPDIIAFKDKEIATFEIKKHTTEISKAVGQCLFYLQNANKAYVILPRKEIKKIHQESLDLFKKYGIGLIQIGKGIKVIIEPKFFQTNNEEIVKKLKDKSLSRINFSRNDSTLSQSFKKEIKDKIIKILSKHSEGLIINELSEILGIRRHTLIKYIYQLVGEQSIYQRKIGSAKLCFLRVENDKK